MVLGVFVFCLNNSLFADEGLIYGWKTEGTFIVNEFSISNLQKNNNRVNNEQLENIITYGEAFILSSETFSEYILLLHLKSGGRIEIKCYQDKPITEQAASVSSSESKNNLFIRNMRRLLIEGSGTLKEFDRNSRLIKEKKYDSIIGYVSIDLIAKGNNGTMTYEFTSEGMYELKLNSNIESEIRQIQIKVNSPY
jgi:hypothetical protein